MSRRDVAEWVCFLLVAVGFAWWVHPGVGLIALGAGWFAWLLWGTEARDGDHEEPAANEHDRGA